MTVEECRHMSRDDTICQFISYIEDTAASTDRDFYPEAVNKMLKYRANGCGQCIPTNLLFKSNLVAGC